MVLHFRLLASSWIAAALNGLQELWLPCRVLTRGRRTWMATAMKGRHLLGLCSTNTFRLILQFTLMRTWMATAMKGQHRLQMWPPLPHVRSSS
jgi:hypothetical protein